MPGAGLFAHDTEGEEEGTGTATDQPPLIKLVRPHWKHLERQRRKATDLLLSLSNDRRAAQ